MPRKNTLRKAGRSFGKNCDCGGFINESSLVFVGGKKISSGVCRKCGMIKVIPLRLTKREKKLMVVKTPPKYKKERDVSYRIHRKDFCEGCGSRGTYMAGDYEVVKHGFLTVHHKDGNRENNNINNLETLCRPCHSERHEPFKRE